MYYKVLKNLRSLYFPCHPWEIGVWYAHPEPRLWHAGYHVTQEPFSYFCPGATIYRIDGQVHEFLGNEAVMGRIRLVRGLNDAEYTDVRCPRAGVVVSGGGHWYAHGDARVSCSNGYVLAHDRSSVHAVGCIVEAFDHAVVDATGGQLYASGRSRVHARDGCQCSAFGHAAVCAHPGSTVHVGGEAEALDCGGIIIRA